MQLTALVLCCAGLLSPAWSLTLQKIRFGYYPDKIRAALDFDGPFTYTLDESRERIIINLPQTEAAPEISNYIESSDLIVRYFEIEKIDDGLKVTVPLSEPVPYSVYTLSDPARLVLDFKRDFTNIISGGTIVDGVEHLKVSRGTASGRITADVLKVDLNKASVAPALALKNKPNALESFINTVSPWRNVDDDKHFFRARVSTIADQQGAVAAVNGTYFAYTGKPLGTLLIDKEMVSSPIYDRTALIINDERQAFIDNVLIDSYFKTAGNLRYNIGGVNQGRKDNSFVLYTPAWGEKTGTDTSGIELILSGSVVREIRLGNSIIPADGYVLSLCGPASQFVNENVKVGDRLDVHLKIIPYTTPLKSVLHMISGGPRLVKEGVAYVSKQEEKFKADVALGRAARTAVGLTKDGKILLVTVDGAPRAKGSRNDRSSIGISLEDLAEMLISLGAVEAMNLDGGGSSTMWIDGRVVNKPANGYEVGVSNALVVKPRF
jgi:exopolysaccharide biosynthesis protein